MLPHEGARKRLCAWRGRAAAADFAAAAAAGDDPATGDDPAAAAPPAEEAGGEAESDTEVGGGVAVRKRPLDWLGAEEQDEIPPDFSRRAVRVDARLARGVSKHATRG